MVEIIPGTVSVTGKTGGAQTISQPITLSGNIVNKPDGLPNVGVFLSGFDLHYDSGDHHILKAIVKVEWSPIAPNKINVQCTLGLRDNSGNWDDAYSGYIAYTVVAETSKS